MKQIELGEDIQQEFPSTSQEAFMGSSDGFWYLREVNEARQAKRITEVPYQPQVLVYTAWDIGYRDLTALWVYQTISGGSVHIIDYYENSGEDLTHYISYLRNKPYFANIHTHHMPHDADAGNMSSGTSVAERGKQLGMRVNILNRFNPKKSTFVAEIQRARNLLARCYFDEKKCSRGLKCLENYRKKWNESMACYTSEPVHDFASHGADAFRYLAQAIEQRSHAGVVDMKQERRKIQKLRRSRVL